MFKLLDYQFLGIRYFYFAFIASTFGDAFRMLAVNVWIFTATDGSTIDRLILVLLGNVPGILLGGLAGVLADRFDRYKTMIISDVLRLLISFGLMVCALTAAPYYALALIAFGNAIGVFFSTSSFAMIPSIVEKEYIPKVNGIMETAQWVLQIVGPSVAAVVLTWFGSSVAFLVDGLSFGLSAVFLIMLSSSCKTSQSLRRKDDVSVQAATETSSLVTDFREGIKYISKNSELLILLLASYGITFIAATTNFTLIFLVSFSLEQKPETLGFLYSLNGVIAVISATLSTALISRSRLAKVLGLSMVGLCAGQIIMGLSPNLTVLAIGVVISAAANAPYNVAITSLYMSRIKSEYLGRVEGVDTTIDNTVTVLSFIVCYLVVNSYGPRWMFLISALVALPFSILASVKVRGNEYSR